jgi:arabinose-5-phosphate isomerase
MSQNIINAGLQTLKLEMNAIANLIENFQEEEFVKAAELLTNVKGKIIFFGIGKTGHIGKKLAATFASTGSSAFFVHAAEANHGDLGMLTNNDILVAISHSGESKELFPTVKACKRAGVPVIGFTNNENSTVGRHSTVVLKNFVSNEACPLGLAPTSSTTVTLALGDALAMAVMQEKGFTTEDFGKSHPGGKLGARTSPVKEFMSKLPVIHNELTILEAFKEVNDYRLGCGVLLNEDETLAGFVSDGDLRRGLVEKGPQEKITDAMIKNPKTINQDQLSIAGQNLLTEYRITSLIVVDDNNLPVGILDKKVCDELLG